MLCCTLGSTASRRCLVWCHHIASHENINLSSGKALMPSERWWNALGEPKAHATSPIIVCHCTQPTPMNAGRVIIIASSCIPSTHLMCGSALFLSPVAVLNSHFWSVKADLLSLVAVLNESGIIIASSCTQRTLLNRGSAIILLAVVLTLTCHGWVR